MTPIAIILVCVMQPITGGEAIHRPPCTSNDIGYITYDKGIVINNYGSCSNGKSIYYSKEDLLKKRIILSPMDMKSKEIKGLAVCK